MKHCFSMVNSEYALEQVCEQKVKGLKVPDSWIAQRQRDEERRRENKSEWEKDKFIVKFKWPTGHRASNGQWSFFEQPDWMIELGLLCLQGHDR